MTKVSILTLLSDRVRPLLAIQTATTGAFQSSPCSATGCDGCYLSIMLSSLRFQSSPCSATGCDRTSLSINPVLDPVSILTLLSDRVRPATLGMP